MDPVKPGRYDDFNTSPWLVLAVLITGVGVIAMGARDLPAWQSLQAAYSVEHPDFEPGLRAAPIGPVVSRTQDELEYCSSCHLAGAGYEALEVGAFAAHPDVWHDPLELGCVPCHRGDPGSLDLHEGPRFGRDRPLPGQLAWASCLHCHDPSADVGVWADWPAVVELQQGLAGSLQVGGCLGCHLITGRGGLVGPDLALLGATPVADPTAVYDCRLDQALQQLEHPETLQPTARMPTPDLDEEEREQLASWLSLLGHIQGQNRDAWVPGDAAAMADTEQVFAGFCQPCHGAAGEGLELGARPAAVPALASHLWRAYTHRDIMRHAIEEGRAGSLMEAFHSDQPDHDAILTQDEVDGLVDLLANGGLVAEPDPLAMTRVVPPSCVLCHFERGDYLEERGDDERLAFLTDHPWQWEVQDWLEDEGFAVASCDEDGVDEDGNPVAVHAGEALYTGLCVHCHEDPELGPAGYTPSAPNLRGCMQRPHFDAGYLLASITIGRPDAPATKWRHQGVTGGEYTPDQLVCLVRWLEDNP